MNPRLQPWQGCTLPLSYSRIYETARRENTLEAASRFELEMEVLQTSALPLGYAADKKIGAGEGFEPATSTLARLHSTTELLPLNEEKVYRRTPLLSSVVSQKTHISFPSFPYAA